MTFNYLALKYINKVKNKITDELPTSLDIGSQTVNFNLQLYKELVNRIEIKSDNQLKIIRKMLHPKEWNGWRPTANDVVLSLGYHEYESIDLNGAYNSYKFDLNLDIQTFYDFHKSYDLVINNGTGEHVFNQFSLYKNIHNLTKKNGIMLNIMPFLGWVNHGFYNFNPIFYADLAAANNYEMIKISFANNNGDEMSLKRNFNSVFEHIKPRHESYFKDFLNSVFKEIGENIFLVAVYRKLTNDVFHIPLQGKYLADVKNDENNYLNQGDGSAKASGQIGILRNFRV